MAAGVKKCSLLYPHCIYSDCIVSLCQLLDQGSISAQQLLRVTPTEVSSRQSSFKVSDDLCSAQYLKKGCHPVGLTDKKLKCVDCGSVFTFRANEQKFFASKGFTREPKRCTACRAAKNQVRGVSHASSGSISRRHLYPAVCVQCGAHTEVPFSPHGGKPVYCNQCQSLHGSIRR